MKDELDDLRSVWNTAQGADPQINTAEFYQIMEQKAKDVYDTLRKNLRKDLIINIITMAVTIGVLSCFKAKNNGMYYALCQMVMLIFVPYLFFYYSLLHVLNKVVAPDSKLIHSLQRMVAHWEQASMIIIWLGILLSPAFFLSVIWFLGCVDHIDTNAFYNRPWYFFALLMLFSSLAASVGFKMWMEYLYGKHIITLKTCLTELEG